MKFMQRNVKLIIIGVVLCLIVLATVIYSYHLIDFKSERESTADTTDSSTVVTDASGDDVESTNGTINNVPSEASKSPTIADLAKDQSIVSVVQSSVGKAKDLEYEEIKEMVTTAVTMAGGFEGMIKDGMTVIIKPNLVTSIDYTLPGWQGRPLNPEVNGTTTDYRVARAIVELVRQYNPNGKVYIMEGSSMDTKACFKQLNYTPEYIPGVDEFIAIESDSGDWRDYNSDKLTKVTVKDALVESEIYMNKRYYDADVIISVPCLKTHWTEVVSGSVKNVGIGATPANIYGTEPVNNNRANVLNHDKVWLDQWIHDFFMAKPVDFTIIDGLQGIQNGPTPCYDQTRTTDIAQDQMNTRLIVASKDCIAADTIESLIMEWDPAAVGYLGYLETSGAGNSNISKIHVEGKRVDEVRMDFKGIAPEGKFTDLTPPNITIKSSEVKDGTLNIVLEGDSKTQKVEVYLGGEYLGVATPTDPSSFLISIPNIDESKLTNDVTLQVYDKYLNYTKKQLMVFNDSQANVKNTILEVGQCNYTAPEALTPPEIDGIASDDCWNDAEWKDINYALGNVTTLPSSEDFSGRYKLTWTKDKLYLLAEITDDVLMDSHPDPLVSYWEDDALEVFIDENHSGGDHRNNYNAFAYHIALDNNVVDLMKASTDKPGLFNDSIKCIRTDNGNLHTWELAINIYSDDYDDSKTTNTPVELTAGKVLGFALAFGDSDKTTRENFVGSVPVPSGQDYGWQSADIFSTLTLVK